MTGQTKNSGPILTLSKKTKKRFSGYVLCGTNEGRVHYFLSGLVIHPVVCHANRKFFVTKKSELLFRSF